MFPRYLLGHGKHMQNSGLLRFGDYTLDLEEKTLNQNGKPVSIPPKVFAILEVLVKNEGRIVEKGDLMNKVWADSFVEESNLTYSIRQLRKILDDDFHQPKFIETVPRRGYRFISKIENVIDNEFSSHQPQEKGLLTRFAEKKGFFVLTITVTVLLGLSVVLGLVFKANKQSPILSKSLKITTLPLAGNINHVAISPNGKLIAYSSTINGQQSVWLKNIETAEGKEIIPSSGSLCFGLVFSKDNENLFISQNLNGKDKTPSVYKYSLFNGTQTKIVENVQGWIGVSPDDKKISFVRYEHKADDYCSLWIADSDGQNQRKLVSRPQRIDIGDNEWTNDGKKIIFANGHANNASQLYSISEVDVETAEERNIVENKFFHIKHLQILKDEKLLVTANFKSEEPSKIWKVDLKTGDFSPLMESETFFANLSINSGEDKLLSIVRKNDFRIYLYPKENPSSFQILTSALAAAFQSDGRIIYSSISGDKSDIFSIKPDGSDLKELTKEPTKERFPLMSDDGRYIFFTSNRTGEDHLWRMNADGSHPMQITKNVGGYPVAIDNEYVYYRRTLDSKLWKTPINSGEEQVVFDKSKHIFSFSKDKSQFAYFDRQNGKAHLSLFSIKEGKNIKSFPLINDDRDIDIAWSPDEKSLYYILLNTKDGYSIWQQDLAGGEARKTTGLGKLRFSPHKNFAFSPDGKYFTLVRGDYLEEAVLIDQAD